jgi:hypothetical protein
VIAFLRTVTPLGATSQSCSTRSDSIRGSATAPSASRPLSRV